VHFHVANLVYLGEVFPGDGYPAVDPAQIGQLDELIKTLSSWTAAISVLSPREGR